MDAQASENKYITENANPDDGLPSALLGKAELGISRCILLGSSATWLLFFAPQSAAAGFQTAAL